MKCLVALLLSAIPLNAKPPTLRLDKASNAILEVNSTRQNLGHFRTISEIFQNSAIQDLPNQSTLTASGLRKYVPKPIEYLQFPSFATFGNKNRTSKREISIFTQISMNRLDLVLGIAESWQGGLSVALFVDAKSEAEKLDALLASLESRMKKEPFNQCKLVISLLFGVEFIASPTVLSSIHPYDRLYPINALRNLALREAQAELVLSLDADFVPSSNMFNYVTRFDIHDHLMSQGENTVFVLAAFELLVKSGYSLPISRQDLERLCISAKIVPFHSKMILDPNFLDEAEMTRWYLFPFQLKFVGAEEKS